MQALFRSNNTAGQIIRVPAQGWGLTALLLLALALAGCGASSEPAPGPTTAAPAVSQDTQPAAAPPETLSPAETAQPGQPPVDAVPDPTEPPGQSEPQPTEPPMATEDVPTAIPAATATPEPEPTTMAEPETLAGGGFVIGEGSEATFTVNEKLAWLDLPNDAVMNTTGISGKIYLDGQPSVIDLDLHSMTSDSDRRDGYVRNRMFPNDRTATFTVADLGDLPDPLPEGEVIAREVQGELTIMGVTKPIVFDVEARKDPDKLFVLGRTTFTWDELEIPPPNIPGRIQVKDEVRVEVLLSAVPDDGAGS